MGEDRAVPALPGGHPLPAAPPPPPLAGDASLRRRSDRPEPADAPQPPSMDTIVDEVVRRIEQRVIDELDRRGRRRGHRGL